MQIAIELWTVLEHLGEIAPRCRSHGQGWGMSTALSLLTPTHAAPQFQLKRGPKPWPTPPSKQEDLLHPCFMQSWYLSRTPWLGRGQSVTASCPRATRHQQTCMVYSIVNHRNPPPSCSNPVSSLGAAHQLSTGRHLVLVQVRHLQMCWVATSSYITNLYSHRTMNFHHSSSPEVSALSRPTAFISAGTSHLLPHTSASGHLQISSQLQRLFHCRGQSWESFSSLLLFSSSSSRLLQVRWKIGEMETKRGNVQRSPSLYALGLLSYINSLSLFIAYWVKVLDLPVVSF